MVLETLASPGPRGGPTDPTGSPRHRALLSPFSSLQFPLSLPGPGSQAFPATTWSVQWVTATLASQAAICPLAVWLGSGPLTSIAPQVGPGPAWPPDGLPESQSHPSLCLGPSPAWRLPFHLLSIHPTTPTQASSFQRLPLCLLPPVSLLPGGCRETTEAGIGGLGRWVLEQPLTCPGQSFRGLVLGLMPGHAGRPCPQSRALPRKGEELGVGGQHPLPGTPLSSPTSCSSPAQPPRLPRTPRKEGPRQLALLHPGVPPALHLVCLPPDPRGGAPGSPEALGRPGPGALPSAQRPHPPKPGGPARPFTGPPPSRVPHQLPSPQAYLWVAPQGS